MLSKIFKIITHKGIILSNIINIINYNKIYYIIKYIIYYNNNVDVVK